MTGTDIAMPVLDGERVLIVEDGEDAAAALTALLRLKGFNARAVLTGTGAVAAAKTTRPQVVLLDLGLPDTDGHDVLCRLRELPDPPAVVVVSGHADPKRQQAAIEAGAAGYLVKPADPDALVALVRQLCTAEPAAG